MFGGKQKNGNVERLRFLSIESHTGNYGINHFVFYSISFVYVSDLKTSLMTWVQSIETGRWELTIE